MKRYTAQGGHWHNRLADFIADFRAAPDGTTAEIRIGWAEELDLPAIHITLGKNQHMMTTSEARFLADIAEEALHLFPHEDAVSELILTLRYAADMADKAVEQIKAEAEKMSKE